MLKWSFLLVGSLTALAVSSISSNAQSVHARDGNILITNRLGRTKTLTTSGRDSQPSISADKKRIVFVRNISGERVETNLGDEEATELWMVDSDGRKPERLVSGKEDSDPQKSLAALGSPQFSPDGLKVYFLSVAWVTSLAIHVIDVRSRIDSFVCPGNTLRVIQRGKYRGYLIAQQHKYYLGERGGSYDHYWLLTPKGKEIRRIGGERDYRNFKKRN
jgi:Tol biopolymer transport system component